MFFNKLLLIGVCVVFLLSSQVPKTQALTVDDIRVQIAILQAQIQALQQQLVDVEEVPWCHDFKIKLGFTNRGEEVKQLQMALQKEGFYNGTIDGTYGNLLASAVTGFQQKYYTDTLAPWGLKYGTGYAGRTTIAKLTAIYGCGVVQPTPTPVESYIKIIAPNGGEVWNTGSTYNIKWNVPDITRVSIYVLDHSTGRPSTVSTGIVAVVPNTGSYQWKIPSSMPAGNYRVRVLGCPDSFSNTACANVGMSNAYGYDESDDYFSIVESGATTCTDSDGGRDIYTKGTATGNSYYRFSADELAHGQGLGVTKAFTEYCRDSNTVTEFYCVKAGVSSPLSSGTEIVAVAINCPGGCYDGACASPVEEVDITVISPNGGEVWNTGSTYNIKWNVPDITRVSIYVLDHSTGRPSTVSTGIVAVLSNTGSYQWKIPSAMPAGNYRVRVLGCPDSFSNTACANVGMSNAYGYDESDDYFSIVESAVMTCTDSDGGKDYYTKGTVADDGNRYIDYCLSSDKVREYWCTEENIYGLGGAAEHDYVCPNICDSGACVDQAEEPSITVVSPNGADQWAFGSAYYIKWSSQGVDKVDIHLEKWAGEDGQIIDENITASTGWYSWPLGHLKGGTIASAGGYYKIRVIDSTDDSSYSQQVADNSDDYFSIVESAVMTCTDSDGGKDYYVKGILKHLNPVLGETILNDVCDSNSNILYERYCDQDIFGNPSGETEVYLCPNGCENGACIADTIEPSITVISPNGGEVWNTGSTYNIKWNVPDITRVSIYVLDHSTGRPSTVSTGIVAVVPNTGSYQWKIPSSMPAGNYRVRVLGCPDSFSNTACANVIMSDYGYDESDSYFSITEETAGVTSPCGNYGDVDGDGFVTQADSDLVLNYGVGNVTLTAEQIENADVSNNGATSAYDSALILQYIEGIITTFPACPVGTLNNVENSLANISKATDELMKKIAELLKK